MPTVEKKVTEKFDSSTENPTNLRANSDDTPIIEGQNSDSSRNAQSSGSEKGNDLIIKLSNSSETAFHLQKRRRLGSKNMKDSKGHKMGVKTIGPYRIPRFRPFHLNEDAHDQPSTSLGPPKRQNDYYSYKSTSRTENYIFRKLKQKSTLESLKEKVGAEYYEDCQSKLKAKMENTIIEKLPKTIEERQFYAQLTNLPIDKDHVHGNESKLAIETQKRLLYDFIDVNIGEKKFMFLWNKYIIENPAYSTLHLVYNLKKFIESQGDEIISQNLYRNFLLHLSHLVNAKCIGNQDMVEFVLVIQEKFLLTRAIERGVTHYGRNAFPVPTQIAEFTLDGFTEVVEDVCDDNMNKVEVQTSERNCDSRILSEEKEADIANKRTKMLTVLLPEAPGDETFLLCRKLLDNNGREELPCPCCKRN